MTPDPRTLAQAEMFGNRLRKNLRHRRKWARRAGVTCYRLYDRDIPEVPLSVDLLEGWAHIAEFARGEGSADPAWLATQVAAAAEVLQIPADHVFVKHRERQRGTQQYTRVDDSAAEQVVHEGGLRFRVNLSDYLDTGLFLDHRQTRAMVRDASAGRRVLNLFAYTGTFTAYAADGGARATTTVDLSRTYLDWCRANLVLNDLEGPQHERIHADVLPWLAAQPADSYDVVVCDPPTFSNSKRMDGVFDIQRDHGALLAATLRVTAPGGRVWFSTNRRRFRFEFEAPHATVQDITDQTVPPDFVSKRPHRCWLIEKS